MIEPKVTRQVFLGEPVEEVLAMAGWSLKHEGKAEFEPEKILPAWAKKRSRGYWRVEGRRVEECCCCHGTKWVQTHEYRADAMTWTPTKRGFAPKVGVKH